MVTRTYVRTGDSLPFYAKGDKIVMDDDFPIPAGWTREDQLLSINQIPAQGHSVAPKYKPGDLVESLVNFPHTLTRGRQYIVKTYDVSQTPGLGGVITFIDDKGQTNCLYETNFIPVTATAVMAAGGLDPSLVKTTGQAKKQSSRRLSSLGEKVKSEYESLYAKQGCTCDPSEPYKCEHCRHPGNPRNIDFFEEYWEAAPAKSRADEIWDAITQAAGKGNT